MTRTRIEDGSNPAAGPSLAVEAGGRPQVRGWRWRIAGGGRPGLTHVLPVAVAVRRMAEDQQFALTGSRRLPRCLHGTTATAGRQYHPDAYYLPEDCDGDGAIDHILVHAHDGLGADAIRILAHCRELSVDGLGSVGLEPVWMGREMSGGLYGPALNWVSMSPVFASPRLHRLDIAGRVLDELDRQREGRRRHAPHLPPIPAVEVHYAPSGPVQSGPPLTANDFISSREGGVAPRQIPPPAFVRLVFEEPFTGPLALGHEAHFGMGLFVPIASS